MTKWIAMAPAVFLVTALAHDYAYQPAEHATGSIGGHVAADCQIPPAAPQGDVRLASFGLAELRPANGSGDGRPALHLRMVVSNNDAQPWTVDTREQKLDVQSAGSIPPAFSSTHEGNAGLALITPLGIPAPVVRACGDVPLADLAAPAMTAPIGFGLLLSLLLSRADPQGVRDLGAAN